MIAPYSVGADGALVAAMPCSCPWHAAGDGACNLWVDHHRDRKTGPCFALAVVRCGPHRHAFTLYPPGHVPYGRDAVAPVSADGALVHDAPSAEESKPSEPPLAWTGTVFGAALDAAAGRPWPRRHPARWRTQGRALVRGARLVGIAPRPRGDALRHRERMARRLGVPTLGLIAGARRWDEARGYRARGAAIVSILDELERARTLADRMLSAGAVAELWGRAIRWEPASQVLRRLPFS
jgi:hypothetical protein